MKALKILFLLFWSAVSLAEAVTDTQLAVWANEAIVATYTYDYKNFLQRQRDIAHYFSAEGWMAYSTALNASKLPDAVMKNAYFVSAVATLPPQVKTLNTNQWQAVMPILVLYKNPQFQQTQSLTITMNFSAAPSGQGVRGFAINNLQAKTSAPPCECIPVQESTPPKSDNPS
ncbi:MAG: DotI/IcmL family type IV secretion protein [Silvanigrellaceae bacterium]|nr:DotI/IcmL family type IV secretion protein [Silvanigrellaceae bacterium]